MIFGGLEFLLLGALGVAALSGFWEDIIGFFKKMYMALPDGIKKTLVDVACFIEKKASQFSHKLKTYSYTKEKNKWVETTQTREVSYDQIPESIRNKLNKNHSVDITDDFKQQLELSSK